MDAGLVFAMKSKIDMRELVEYIRKVTGFDRRDIKEILQAEREYLIEKEIKEENQQPSF